MSWFRKNNHISEVIEPMLFDETNFYNNFIPDLLNAKEEVIIESPYITLHRLNQLKPIFEKLINKGIEIFVITRYPEDHDEMMAEQAELGIQYFEALGVQVLLCANNHHRKLAIIDRKILWEGSLNILSQAHSREFMRRINSKQEAEAMFKFLKFDQVKFFKKKLNLL